MNKAEVNKSKHFYLVTGAAGFIGMHTCLRLLERGEKVFGIDNLNDYYDVSLKQARLEQLFCFKNFVFEKQDIADKNAMEKLFTKNQFTHVIHLAAQAGVRYSIEQPHLYIDANILGFMNILEACRKHPVAHLVYASSSSVYGGNTGLPFKEGDNVDHPLSLYAATKKSNELMAHTYSHLFSIPVTGLRFFTVYGPWGRPDMALFLFTKAILSGNAIDVFNNGEMLRDFTYIDDVVEGVLRVIDKPAIPNMNFDTAHPDPASSFAPYRLFNLGNSNPVSLMSYIDALESALGKVADKNFLPMQAGDVVATASDTNAMYEWVGFKPSMSVEQGVKRFVEWYRKYYCV